MLRDDQRLIAEWIGKGSRVLDLGCGDGALLAHLRETRGVTGYGIEIDPANIVHCIETGIPVIQSDLDQGLLDFEAGSFDHVIMTQTLQAVRYPDRLLTEMLRVGREGIVTFPNMGHWRARLQLLGGHMPKNRVLPHAWYNTPNIHLCTLADFEDLCGEIGIKILNRTAVDRTHARLSIGLLPTLFGEIALYRLARDPGFDMPAPAALTPHVADNYDPDAAI
jgi:methionine biosynthesis protein MetW